MTVTAMRVVALMVLSPGTGAMPLNYFIYPHLEVGGKPWRAGLETAFSYRELASG